ncbi:hypothetical protein MtrunA17_Chr3g0142341 [Medicago truncatula]|uniref:Uncharacterized protein n=1 Tax=Medicago truncatula TaxID=3880 RepID=A0A396IZ91_MEDTR|nr:hypothetical protein MtrunA17_Chr3g0142341 [Medicago truncatula]
MCRHGFSFCACQWQPYDGVSFKVWVTAGRSFVSISLSFGGEGS